MYNLTSRKVCQEVVVELKKPKAKPRKDLSTPPLLTLLLLKTPIPLSLTMNVQGEEQEWEKEGVQLPANL